METENNVCSICLHEFTQPKLLTCLHSYCYQCLLDYVNRSKQDGDKFPCPLCRNLIQLPSGGVQDFPDSPHGQINEVGDVVKSSEAVDDVTSSGATNERPQQICDVCDNEHMLKFRCKTCQQTLCDDCKTSHDKYFVKKKHDVIDICRIEEEEKGRHVRGVELKGTSDGVCTVHPYEPIIVHCTQCTVSVCALCFTKLHNGHQVLYLNNEETQTKLRHDLQKLNDHLQLHVDRLETFSQQLASERSKLQNSTEQECNRVDEQVKLMCKMVKTQGDEIKTMFRNTNDTERKNLETLMAEMDSSINRLKSDIKNALVSLEGESIIKILETTQINQKVETEFKFKDLVLPDLENPSFKVGKLKEDELFQQLGSYENNKVQNFALNYNINTILNDKVLRQGKYFTFSELKWGVGAERKNDDYLGVYLFLCKADYNSRDERVEYSCTLINKTPSKSITDSLKGEFSPGGNGWGNPKFTPWSTLTDPSNGFTDKDGHFSVRIRIKTLKPLPV